ncbi:MAG: bifunctional serine/threonine-protein kinase/formylglycine-generating enzyme family protein [Crocosphaera sp.]|nr:bifunctional serine/threonine-protein kinase/formylglycine-generating enzyme family protein [Crocosphaera sp.]
MSLYCLNPACSFPDNANNHKFCHGCGQPLADTTQGYLFRDRYLIKQILGEGNFGRTYLVEDQNFNHRKRVLKKFIAAFQGAILETAKTLFKREAEILDTLKHEQIPAIYDHFEEENSLYLVEEYIEGEDLITEFNREGKFSQKKIKYLLEDLLPVLDYLHQKNLLHRDIKPDNIMRRRHDSKLILIDFGGVKEVSKTRGTLIYTPGYGSIEQMTGNPQTASDIYSLGATCVRLMTGYFPSENNENDPIYDSNTATWLWKDYLHNQGVEIEQILSNILDKMLAHFPQDRYQNSQEILLELNPPVSCAKPLDITEDLSESESKLINQSSFKELTKKENILIYTTVVISIIIIIFIVRFLAAQSSLNVGTFVGAFLICLCLANLVFILFKNIKKRRIKIKYSQNSIIHNKLAQPTTLQVNSANPSTVAPNTSITSSSTPTKQPNKNLISSLKSFQFEVITVNTKGEIIKRENRENEYFTVKLSQDINLEMVVIPGGNFWMGTSKKEGKNSQQEKPQHRVNLSSFCMAKYPITQGQWKQIMEQNPAYFKGDNRPVENVSLYDCLDFCKKLSELVGIQLTLPSEAQWEYACRGVINSNQYKQLDGTQIYQPFHFGATITEQLANYNCSRTYQQEPIGIYFPKTIDVGSFYPNNFGLYDLHGNVWEWCGDTWHENYQNAPQDGKIWLNGNDKYSPMRGGSWAAFPFYCRCAIRNKVQRNNRSYDHGFRVVYNFKK